MKVDFHFDSKTHTYRSKGIRLPSVTETINCIVPQWKASQWHLGRGRAMHEAIRLLGKGRLDWSSVDLEIILRVRAVEKILKDYNLKVVATELHLPSRRYWFAGTLDALLQSPNGCLILADWKSSLTDAVIPQLGGYSLLYTENNHGAKLNEAAGIGLEDDQRPKFLWLVGKELRAAENAFLHFHSTAGWLRQHGYVKEKAA